MPWLRLFWAARPVIAELFDADDKNMPLRSKIFVALWQNYDEVVDSGMIMTFSALARETWVTRNLGLPAFRGGNALLK
jgi:hypothetical protein